MVEVAARPGGPESGLPPIGLDTLHETLCSLVVRPNRSVDGPFVFAVDHCFAIQGQVIVPTSIGYLNSAGDCHDWYRSQWKYCRKRHSGASSDEGQERCVLRAHFERR